MGFNRIYTPEGKYFDLTTDDVKQYLSYELVSSPNILRVYTEGESKDAYQHLIRTSKLENCKDIWDRTEGLEN